MSEETHKVLEMLSSGKITVQEAEQLLHGGEGGEPERGEERPSRGTSASSSTNRPATGRRRRTSTSRCRSPSCAAGCGSAAVFPGLLGKKKIQLDNGTELDLSKIHYADLEAMIKDIGELTVDVDGDAQVRIRCE